MADLKFRCTSCDLLLRAKSGPAGRKARCPRCGTLTPVPLCTTTENCPPEPSTTENLPAQPTRTSSESTEAQAPAVAEDPTIPSLPKASRRKRQRSVARGNDDPRYNRRNYSGWRKVRLGLLVLLIAFTGPLLAWPILYFLSIGLLGLVRILLGMMFCLLALTCFGYFLCSFVPATGWVKKLAITNFGLATLALALLAFLMLWLAIASDPLKIEEKVAKTQADTKAWEEKFKQEFARIEAETKAQEEKIKERLKEKNNPVDLKQLNDLKKEKQVKLNQLM